jgi:hypothetical protein
MYRDIMSGARSDRCSIEHGWTDAKKGGILNRCVVQNGKTTAADEAKGIRIEFFWTLFLQRTNSQATPAVEHAAMDFFLFEDFLSIIQGCFQQLFIMRKCRRRLGEEFNAKVAKFRRQGVFARDLVVNKSFRALRRSFYAF